MKKILVVLMALLLLCLSACGQSSTPQSSSDNSAATTKAVRNQEMTLSFSFGEKTGKYSGPLNADGLPDGIGTFTSKNSEGISWTYSGSFVNGHFEGEGQTEWQGGLIERGIYANDEVLPLDSSLFQTVYNNADEYVGYCLDITGKVFQTGRHEDDDGIWFQMHQDAENSENNVVVHAYDMTVSEDDYVRVFGRVQGSVEFTNYFGAPIKSISLSAKDIQKVSYAEAVRPAKRVVEVNETQTQYGYSVCVEKVEFAEKETRVYVSVDNQGKEKFSLYTYSSTVSQNGKQYGEQTNYSADYPRVQTDLRVGNKSDGIITFPALDQSTFTLYLSGSSGSWEEKLEEFVFDIVVP